MVMRIGSDRQGGMARMKDVAAWCAHLLGVKVPIKPEYLTNYSDDVNKAVRMAVEASPR